MATAHYKKLSTIENKIIDIKDGNPAFDIVYFVNNESTQKELRLNAKWSIELKVDYLHCPKNMKGYNTHPAWQKWRDLDFEINKVKYVSRNSDYFTFHVSAKSVIGKKQREEVENDFRIDFGNSFLTAYSEAKKELKSTRKIIADIQAQQKELLKEMRKANSEYMAERKEAAAAKREKNSQALESGEFWNADQKTLKQYFNPPFNKNYLADVSEEWRAALFLECTPISFKYGKNWGHKMGGTGKAYLCGIDDNGDEWGHEVELNLSYNEYGDGLVLNASVEDAMMELFDISRQNLSSSFRQGDLLFSSTSIPEETELTEQDGPWEIRESHVVESQGLLRNGRYFTSKNEIHVNHTSHHPLTLPAGDYRLYELQVEDAD